MNDMAQPGTSIPPGLDEDIALRTILEGTATATGERFFTALVENLARALNTRGAWVTEYLADARRLRALAFWMDGQWIQDYEHDIDGTPCEAVIENGRLVHYPDKVLELYPHDPDVTKLGAVSYMGVPLKDVDGRILGHLAVMDTKPMRDERAIAVFQIFAARAAAELQRMRAENRVRDSEQKLRRLLYSTMDAIVELDRNLRISLMNPAAEKIFGAAFTQVAGEDFQAFLTRESRIKLARLIAELDARPEGQRSLWIAGGLEAMASSGQPFPAEATLSQYGPSPHQPFYTLILRDVNERLEAERRIQSLSRETEYLKEELKALHNVDEIIGRSNSLSRALHDVQQVAGTDTYVLIHGETGTGKELFARAIHDSSTRRSKPFIKVNCAALPATLIESELFGHEKGAFTGATQRREGRFSLADGGTLFLDEISELPLDLQAKMLRVLQEGEFEPVGSSHTRKVDVRVLAATNVDLQQAVRDGRFREDLYYRLNVFPIHVPPLRQRGDDIVLLAATFAEKFAKRMGRSLEPLSPACIQRLKAYDWPGNVRELQNVIERAVITSRGSHINLDRALPDTADSRSPGAGPPADDAAPRVRTVTELQQLERDNIILALKTCGGRVAGENGAARLLGMNPSTLSSRMKTLGITRP